MVYTCLHMLKNHLWGWFSYWLLALLRVRWSKNNNYPTKTKNMLFPWSFFMLGSQCQNVVPFRMANSQKMPIYIGVQSLSASTSWNHGFYPICSTFFDHVRPIFYMSPKNQEVKDVKVRRSPLPLVVPRRLFLLGFPKSDSPGFGKSILGTSKSPPRRWPSWLFGGPKWHGVATGDL